MLDNPFTYGKPISDETRFFGRRDEANQILGRLRNAESESSSLIGERRIGKTSLLNYLQDLNVRSSHRLDPEKYLFIYMDLRLVVNQETTPMRLWQRLLEGIIKCCRDVEVRDIVGDTLERLKKQKITALVDGLVLSDLFSKLEKKDLHVVFLFDEFERVTTNQNFDSDFFNLLRSLAIEYPLALITSTRRGLVDLCHSNAIRSSPFFNIFAPIYLLPLDKNDAKELISCLLSGTGVAFTDVDMNAIFHIAGTHPYFLKMACFCLFEAYSRNSLNKHDFMYKSFEKQVNQQLMHYWHDTDDREKIVLTVLALSEQQRKIKGLGFTIKQMEGLCLRYGQVLKRLEERSLVVSKAGMYCSFGAVFSEWIYKEITDTVQDKQSYEEWLESNRPMQVRLSSKAGKGIREILPKVSSKYREMIVTWASDPRNFVIIADLFKATLGLH